jgi:predicted Zn-dependent protease
MDQDAQFDAMVAIRESIEAGDEQAARKGLADLIGSNQTDWWVRNYAAACFERLGDPERARIEAGIAVALEPDNFAAFKRVASYLAADGQRDAAQKVLERGWGHVKKLHPKKQWADERALYFAISENELPPHLAERMRREREQIEAATTEYSMGRRD